MDTVFRQLLWEVWLRKPGRSLKGTSGYLERCPASVLGLCTLVSVWGNSGISLAWELWKMQILSLPSLQSYWLRNSESRAQRTIAFAILLKVCGDGLQAPKSLRIDSVSVSMFNFFTSLIAVQWGGKTWTHTLQSILEMALREPQKYEMSCQDTTVKFVILLSWVVFKDVPFSGVFVLLHSLPTPQYVDLT